MLRACYGDARVEEWGVLDGVAIEALGTVFKHSWGRVVGNIGLDLAPGQRHSAEPFIDVVT